MDDALGEGIVRLELHRVQPEPRHPGRRHAVGQVRVPGGHEVQDDGLRLGDQGIHQALHRGQGRGVQVRHHALPLVELGIGALVEPRECIRPVEEVPDEAWVGAQQGMVREPGRG